MDLSILESYGIDYKKGIMRCMNDEQFYVQILSMFMRDGSFQCAKAAFEEKNYKTMFESLHELKGACGNVEMRELFEAICPLVELLRANKGSYEEIEELFEKVEPAYARAREGISLAIGDSYK